MSSERSCHGKIDRPPKVGSWEEQINHQETHDRAKVGAAFENDFDSQGDVPAAAAGCGRDDFREDPRRDGTR